VIGTARALSLPAVSRPVAALVCLALLAAGCGGSKQKPATSPKPTKTPAAAATRQGGCAKVADPGPKHEPKLSKPSTKLDSKKTYVATVSTSCGDFQITLDAERAPKTGGNFAYLVSKHFFDHLTFHRIVPDFVIQGGDPAGNGTGGPGYTVVETPPHNLHYDVGVVAMAKTQTDPAGASGSQFFVVTGSGAAGLDPVYALLGKVTAGMDVVKKIGAVPADQQGTPATPIVIESIRIKTS
jgi:peptidyl-prolyl cis-trans isomerase B (cyclophilin B)